jgi:enamine deaminase RidA (YjgF/YER057c/UK114 family)
MATKTSDKSSATKTQPEALLPVELGRARIPYARGMRAGNWVFATGQMGQDFKTGVPADVVSADLPYGGRPKQEKEADLLFRNLGEVLKAGGTDFGNVIRFDQYYTSPEPVYPYHMARFSRFPKGIPPSTSVLMSKMVLPDAEMDVQAVAVVSGDIERLSNPSLYVPASSGFSPGYKVGDYVLPSGAMASPPNGQPDRDGMAMEASSPPWTRWSGRQIELETRYIVANKMKHTLGLAKATLGQVVKGQAYITRVEDAAVFHAAWQAIFKDSPVPVTVVPMPDPAFGNKTAYTEINLIGLVDGGQTKKEVIDAGVFTGYEGQPNAVRAGDLLLLNGMMAAERTGLAPEAKADPHQPWFASTVKGQARSILTKAQKICEAAGTSLENVVRIQQFHTDISEFYPVMEVWQEFLPGRPLPFSAVQCGPAMPVPGATVLMDLWVYAP